MIFEEVELSPIISNLLSVISKKSLQTSKSLEAYIVTTI